MRYNIDVPYSLGLDGVYLCHNGFGIVINPNAVIGKGTVIQNSVCIGEMDESHKSPIIGENVFIGCHACILGNIRIGNKIGFVSPERRYEAPTVARPPQM